MAGVPQDQVARTIEGAMEGERELNNAKVRPEVPARGRHLLHQKCSDLRGQLIELKLTQRPQVARLVDLIQQRHAGPSTIRSIARARVYTRTPASLPTPRDVTPDQCMPESP